MCKKLLPGLLPAQETHVCAFKTFAQDGPLPILVMLLLLLLLLLMWLLMLVLLVLLEMLVMLRGSERSLSVQ